MSRFALISCIVLQAFVAISAQKHVICYWGTWAIYRNGFGKFDVSNIDPTICTHIIYAFLGANEDGSVRYADPNADLSENSGKGFIDKFIALKSKSPSTNFLMSIGGWEAGSYNFSKIAGSPATRDAFAQNVLNMLNKHGFDGFDFDWEYPAERDTAYGAVDKPNFVLLLQALYSKLNGNGKLLSIAVGASQSKASVAYDIRNVSRYVDLINLMTYDLHGSDVKTTGTYAPLYADDTSQQKKHNVDDCIKYWLSQDAPRSKIVLGMGVYGRSYTLSDPMCNGVGAAAISAGRVGNFVNEKGFLAYNEICYNLKNNQFTRVWDSTGKVPYVVNRDQWIGYDDAESLTYKIDYIKNNNLAGAMLWSIETDDFDNICEQGKFPLVSMIYKALVGNVPLAKTKTKTSSSGGSFVCPSANGLFKDPDNCNRFYSCVNNNPHLKNCGAGLYFNTNGYCDSSVIC